MSGRRTQKGTRVRGLPPKLLLSRRQDATGSFPTTWRTSTDGRTGRYNTFFNDIKTIPFNQHVVASSGFASVAYEERGISVGSPSVTSEVEFATPFVGNPIVILTDLSSSDGSVVNGFISSLSASSFTASFSAPFEGSYVYRAIYDLPFGTPRTVLRSPRFPAAYAKVVATYDKFAPASNTLDLSFSDFGSVPTDSFVTFYDFFQNGQANVSGSITYLTNTSVAITASANARVYANFLGSTLPDGAVEPGGGIVYPLVMTPQAVSVGMSGEDQDELFSRAYFASGALVNQPIITSGKMVRGVSDAFVTATPGQYLSPWSDAGNSGADAKSAVLTASFFATGSRVDVAGPGFQQPLWSKHKIELDITPATSQSFSLSIDGTAGSYPMGYWNPVARQYEGLGTGKSIGVPTFTGDADGVRAQLEELPLGFGPSMDNGALPAGLPQAYNLYGRQIDNFGFPYHSKFQPTSSQQIAMSDHLASPFLLEKVVVEFSGAISNAFVSTNTAGWTFFLLNSRGNVPGRVSPPITVEYKVASGPAAPATLTTSSVMTSRTLDVVDHCQLFLSNSRDTNGFLNREGFVIKSGETLASQFSLLSTVKSSISYDGFGSRVSGSIFTNQTWLIPALKGFGRGQTNDASGRDWRGAFEKPAVIAQGTYDLYGYTATVNVNAAYTKPNPYVLLPTDRLTFGFQLPWDRWNSATSGIEFAPTGINKITLYGSTLRYNPDTNRLEEYHENTLNQLLCSTSLHEVIGDEDT